MINSHSKSFKIFNILKFMTITKYRRQHAAQVGKGARVVFWNVLNLHGQLIILQDQIAISEFEAHRLESILKKFCAEQGPPAHIRDQLQWGFRIDPVQQTVELFEIRPYFMDASRKIESKFAKAAYVKTSKTWKVYWMRGTGKWTKYAPCPKVKAIEEFLKVVKEDAFHCFFG